MKFGSAAERCNHSTTTAANKETPLETMGADTKGCRGGQVSADSTMQDYQTSARGAIMSCLSARPHNTCCLPHNVRVTDVMLLGFFFLKDTKNDFSHISK